MADATYNHGVRVFDAGTTYRAIQLDNQTSIAVVFTAEEADEDVFPLDTVVSVFSNDPAVLAEGKKRRKLYIAPVTLAYLRPVEKALSSQELAWGVQRQAAEVAVRLRQEFAEAFRRSPNPYYQLVTQPGADTLTLQLALIELQPTSPKGNAVMTVLKFAVTPVAALGRFFTKGNIAIEGRVALSKTGRAFFQFADNEQDKLTFINVRDFQPYGHAATAIREWALQFELMTRTPSGVRVEDSRGFTLRPN